MKVSKLICAFILATSLCCLLLGSSAGVKKHGVSHISNNNESVVSPQQLAAEADRLYTHVNQLFATAGTREQYVALEKANAKLQRRYDRKCYRIYRKHYPNADSEVPTYDDYQNYASDHSLSCHNSRAFHKEYKRLLGDYAQEYSHLQILICNLDVAPFFDSLGHLFPAPNKRIGLGTTNWLFAYNPKDIGKIQPLNSKDSFSTTDFLSCLHSDATPLAAWQAYLLTRPDYRPQPDPADYWDWIVEAFAYPDILITSFDTLISLIPEYAHVSQDSLQKLLPHIYPLGDKYLIRSCAITWKREVRTDSVLVGFDANGSPTIRYLSPNPKKTEEESASFAFDEEEFIDDNEDPLQIHLHFEKPYDFTATSRQGYTFAYRILSDSTSVELVEPVRMPRSVRKLKIPSHVRYNGKRFNVTTIGEEAFGDVWINIRHLVIPRGITTLRKNAFSYCAITKIRLPRTLTRIENGAIKLNRISHLKLPPYLRHLEFAAISSQYLSTLYIPAGLIHLDRSSGNEGNFADFAQIKVARNNPRYTALDGVLFSKNLDTLIYYPVGKADSIYAIPASVRHIADDAFSKTVHLRKVVLPNELRSIGDCNFHFVAVDNIPDSLRTIGYSCLQYCRPEYAVKSLVFPPTFDSLGEGSIYNKWLRSVTFLNPHVKIGDGAFWMCENLDSIRVADSASGRLVNRKIETVYYRLKYSNLKLLR